MVKQTLMMHVNRARANSEVDLHTSIADAYLQGGKYRIARIYVERIYGPLYSMDNRRNRLKFPLIIPADSQVAAGTYAKLLYVAARISLVHGRYYEADAELAEAHEFDASNIDIIQLQKQVNERREARAPAYKRRWLEKERQEQRKIKEHQGM